ncbi:chemotaxis protein MotA [Bryocella elongata]|uniref:Chemotaxis protein MotA n=1 Tax=Bryocella elongata TaxID=863522 RepID=A0A1H5TN89_9BACT|nr:flagellar motor protein [Bryocella elongata]SEF63487.1 chemotaxis protein MotA [Bryocella elongata]
MDKSERVPQEKSSVRQGSAVVGLIVGVFGVGAGLVLDGGNLRQILQPTAALIVFGGTLGAVLVQFPFSVVGRALTMLRQVFLGGEDKAAQLIDELGRYAMQARKHGLLSLDSALTAIPDTFLRYCLTQAIDGARSEDLRHSIEGLMQAEMDRDYALPMVFESAGGFAPTIGILGAVIGLIQVMQHLSNIEEVGKGIAAAFVATLYGVGSANLFFLPCAGRMRALVDRRQAMRELALEGVIAILEKNTPRAVEKRLACFLPEPPAESISQTVLQ